MKDSVLQSEYKEPITATKKKGPRRDMMLEFWCDPESNMEILGKNLSLCVVRLSKERYYFSKPVVILQVIEFVEANPGISLWSSLPCSPWSQWQWMSVQKFGQLYLRKLN
jgi:hypothetical protein